MKSWMRFVPLIAAFALGMLLYKAFDLNPREVPSVLVGQSFPEFKLLSVKDDSEFLTEKDLTGKVALVNVWATWCITCKVEHPYLNKLANETKIPIHGINYVDEWDAAQTWLQDYGDPYDLHMFDPDGRLGLDLGVTGAPETFLIDRNGQIHYRHQGEVNDRVWNGVLLPKIAEIDIELAMSYGFNPKANSAVADGSVKE